jgi:hypothetical protein
MAAKPTAVSRIDFLKLFTRGNHRNRKVVKPAGVSVVRLLVRIRRPSGLARGYGW